MNKILKFRFIFIFLPFFITKSVLAGTSYFRVLDLVGDSSLIDEKNESKNMSKGIYLPINAKVMVTQGAQLSLRAESGAVFHLSAGSVLEIWREQLVLLTGTMWVQSSSEEKDYEIETVNSLVEFKKAEFVMSFDDIAKKSQVFVISGHASIANVFMREKKELLVSGEISFIQKDFQQGMPRRPALIGSESLATVFGKFKGIKPGDENFQTILAEKEETIGQEKGIENFTDTRNDSIKNKQGNALAGRSVASENSSKSAINDGGITFIPKDFSAPKRMYPLKNRKIASEEKNESMKVENEKHDKYEKHTKNVHKKTHKKIKEEIKQVSMKSSGSRPVKVYDLRLYQKKNKWSALLETEGSYNKKSIESRAPANIETVKSPSKDKETSKEEDDFSGLMKDLKNVSPDSNEVY